MSEYGSYNPVKGDRITVRRTPGNHGKVGIMVGTVLDVVFIGGMRIMDFRADDYGRAYLATNQQMAEMGKEQTIEKMVN